MVKLNRWSITWMIRYSSLLSFPVRINQQTCWTSLKHFCILTLTLNPIVHSLLSTDAINLFQFSPIIFYPDDENLFLPSDTILKVDLTSCWQEGDKKHLILFAMNCFAKSSSTSSLPLLCLSSSPSCCCRYRLGDTSSSFLAIYYKFLTTAWSSCRFVSLWSKLWL